MTFSVGHHDLLLSLSPFSWIRLFLSEYHTYKLSTFPLHASKVSIWHRPIYKANKRRMNGSHNDAEADDQTVVTLASSMAVGPPDNNNNNINNKNHKLDLLTVFQAAPLAGMNQNGKFQAVGDLDLEFERELLKKTFIGSQIAVDFEIATTDALGSFLARDQGRILHFSCHGSPHCLLLEDNWGGVCTLQTEQIKRWIEVGGKNLQFVFVSACYSSLIGQAFVDANVPHVVCCRYDSKIREAAAGKRSYE